MGSMGKVATGLLREAFIEPIRFALLLDDKFPLYSKLADDGFDAALDNAKAKALFELCRGQGWLCDIDNRGSVAEQFEARKHLHQSDLLILDFNLDPADQNDPTAALKIIQRLSASDHFNLVVVYTTTEVDLVARDIVFSLGGGASSAAPAMEAARASIEDLDAETAQVIADALSWSIIDNYLKGSSQGTSAIDLRTRLAAAQITGAAQTAMVDFLAFDRMRKRLKPEVLTARRPERPVDSSLGRAGSARWVTQDNVFVAIVNKQEEPSVLIDRLVEALEAWDPSPLRVMMMQARAAIEKAGSLADQKVLETSRLQAGWLLRILLGKTDADRRESVGELYGRLFERLAGKAEPSITEFGMKVIGPATDDPIATARTLAGAAHNLGAAKIFHALNEHLASDVCPDGPMTAGVVFKGMRGEAETYWMCASPACDLVPGQNRNGWDGELTPLRPASVVRMRIIKRELSVAVALEEADRGRHVFLFVDGKEVAFQVIEEKSRQMELETILLAGDGLIVDGAFKGHIVELDAGGAPVFKGIDFQVMAKLRADYANRILTQSGQQKSRIGVDFFNLPKPPATEEAQ
jgi:hypothetical protein